jgi:hypothetical protein
MDRVLRRVRIEKILFSSLTAALSAMSCLVGPLAQALSFRSGIDALRPLPRSGHAITFSTLDQDIANSLKQYPGFGLYERGGVDFAKAVSALLRSTSVNPLIEIRSTQVAASFGLTTGGKSHDFRFHVKGTALCGFQVRGHELGDGSTIVMGQVPDVDLYEPAPASDWPDLELAKDKAREVISVETNGSNVTFRGSRRCYYVTNGSLLPVWEMTAIAEGAPYVVRADGYEVASLEPMFFATTGQARVFPFNRLDSALQDVALTGLTGDGSLSSEFLRTKLPAGKQAANEPTHVFSYDPSDFRFDEAMAYSHAQAHLEYVSKLGFAWYGPKPLELKIHTPPQGKKNNALFEPGDESGRYLPTITIDDGDGVGLQNLVSDGDVVSHEFGHHVIYKTLRSVSGESLVLHEGLADFLVFSRTGDPCLGESICPQNSGACIKPGACLRTAANNLSYGDPLWNTWTGSGHLRGQLISGLLWDLRSRPNVPPDDIPRLTMKAISLFAESSGFCDFLTALYASDRDMFGGTYKVALDEIALKRGLGNYLKQVNSCPVNISAMNKMGTVESTASDGSATSKSQKKKILGIRCGVVNPPLDATLDSGIFALFLWGIPLLVTLLKRRENKVRVPRRSRNPSNARNVSK